MKVRGDRGRNEGRRGWAIKKDKKLMRRVGEIEYGREREKEERKRRQGRGKERRKKELREMKKGDEKNGEAREEAQKIIHRMDTEERRKKKMR